MVVVKSLKRKEQEYTGPAKEKERPTPSSTGTSRAFLIQTHGIPVPYASRKARPMGTVTHPTK